MAVTNVPAAMAGANAVFAAVFDSVTINLFGSYDNEYDGRSAVSITRRVLFPGWIPVRTVRNELRAANAMRGNSATITVVNPDIFKTVRRVSFILHNYTKFSGRVQVLYRNKNIAIPEVIL